MATLLSQNRPVHKKFKIKLQGFSLIEVMIFITLLSLVLLTAASYTTRLVLNMKTNEHRIMATYYNEELREWLASEREVDWLLFLSKSSISPGNTYCVNNNIAINANITSLTAGTCPSFNGITTISPSIFKRELNLTTTNPDPSQTEVTATITISWNEGGVLHEERIQSIYTAR